MLASPTYVFTPNMLLPTPGLASAFKLLSPINLVPPEAFQQPDNVGSYPAASSVPCGPFYAFRERAIVLRTSLFRSPARFCHNVCMAFTTYTCGLLRKHREFEALAPELVGLALSSNAWPAWLVQAADYVLGTEMGFAPTRLPWRSWYKSVYFRGRL